MTCGDPKPKGPRVQPCTSSHQQRNPSARQERRGSRAGGGAVIELMSLRSLGSLLTWRFLPREICHAQAETSPRIASQAASVSAAAGSHCRESRSRSYPKISSSHAALVSQRMEIERYLVWSRLWCRGRVCFNTPLLTRSSPIFIHSSNRNTGVLGQHKKRQLRVLLSYYIEQRSVSEPNHQKN